MPMSQSDQEKVTGWINTRVTNGCPMCGGRNWEIVPEVGMHGQVDLESKGVNPAVGVPVVNAICANCGFVAHYAAQKVGLF